MLLKRTIPSKRTCWICLFSTIIFITTQTFLFAQDEKYVKLPFKEGKVCYEYITPMDSSLGKEVLYKASMSWYLKNFPYGHKNLIVDDQVHGRFMASCSSTFNYTWMMDDFTMKFDFVLEIDVRYGKCRLRMHEIQPKDEIKGDENFSGNRIRSTWEERSLEKMYSQYQSSPIKPSFMTDKLNDFNDYFRHLQNSYATEIGRIRTYMRKNDF